MTDEPENIPHACEVCGFALAPECNCPPMDAEMNLAYKWDMHSQGIIDAAILGLHRLLVDDLARDRVAIAGVDQAVALVDLLRRESAAITKRWD